jgi:3-oxoacyl-(acyl-carrier-protein) synthase
MKALHVAGRGEAGEENRKRFDAPAIVAVRYADPASWSAAGAVANATGDALAQVSAAHDRVGVIAISAEGPVEAMGAMTEATRGGFSSPIRFPASNAGSLAGITAIAFGFRGPTLMLTLPPDRGAPVALLLAEAWIARGMAEYVAVVSAARREGKPVSRALLLAGEGSAALDRAREAAWLSEG